MGNFGVRAERDALILPTLIGYYERICVLFGQWAFFGNKGIAEIENDRAAFVNCMSIEMAFCDLVEHSESK